MGVGCGLAVVARERLPVTIALVVEIGIVDVVLLVAVVDSGRVSSSPPDEIGGIFVSGTAKVVCIVAIAVVCVVVAVVVVVVVVVVVAVVGGTHPARAMHSHVLGAFMQSCEDGYCQYFVRSQ